MTISVVEDIDYRPGMSIDVLEGIGDVVSVNKFYVEEYCSEFKAGLKVGEPLRTILVYKIFCDSHGNLRQRMKFRASSSQLCTPLTEASLRVLAATKLKYPKEYQAFQSLKPEKPIKHYLTTWLNIPENIVNEAELTIKEFAEARSTSFTFPELVGALLSEYPNLERKLVLREYERPKNNVYLQLYNDDYIVVDQRAVFVGVRTYIK